MPPSMAAALLAALRTAPANTKRRVLQAARALGALFGLFTTLLLWGYIDNAIVEPLLWHC